MNRQHFSLGRILVWLALLLGWVPGRGLVAQEANPDAIIEQSELFYPRLVAVGENRPTAEESQDLAVLLQQAAKDGFDRHLEDITRYIVGHSQNPWTPALALRTGSRLRSRGAFTQALKLWRVAWDLAKDRTDSTGRAIADESMAQLATLLASLGRITDLEAIRTEVGDRRFYDERTTELHFRAMSSIESMKQNPGRSFRCGTYAMYQIAGLVGRSGDKLQIFNLREESSPEGGFTLEDLQRIAERYEIPLVPVKWASEIQIPVPSVVHWRQNHYAAILKQSGESYLVSDPTFGEPIWIRESVLREEASGYFLIPRSKLLGGWVSVEGEEAKTVRGKGQNGNPPHEDESPTCTPCEDPGCEDTSTGDGNASGNEDLLTGCADCGGGEQHCDSCGEQPDSDLGMARWRVSEPYISLWITDTPLAYNTPREGQVYLNLAYHKKEGNVNTPYPNDITHVGNDWNLNWVSFMEVEYATGTTNFAAKLTSPQLRDFRGADPKGGGGTSSGGGGGGATTTSGGGGGGSAPRSGGGGASLDQGNISTPHPRNRELITPAMSGTNLSSMTMISPDGSKVIYGFPQILTSGEKYRLFMIHRVSALGYTNLTFKYISNSGKILLTEVVDELNQTNRLVYHTTAGKETWVKEVQDPFGRKVYLSYDGSGRLTNIEDVIGINSTIAYTTFTIGASSITHPTSLTTQYGTTTFERLDPFGVAYGVPATQFNGINRALLVSRPSGAKHLFMYRDGSYDLYVNGTYIFPFIPATTTPIPTVPCPPLYNWNTEWRNSFYWSPRHVSHIGLSSISGVTNLTVANYKIARMRNWLHERINIASLSSFLSFERAASPDGSTDGQYTWYSYDGKLPADSPTTCNVDASFAGLWRTPALIARIDPSGETNFLLREFDIMGNIVKSIRSMTLPDNTIGYRTNQYTFSTDKKDLLRHIDAHGNTRMWSYSSGRQVTAFTNLVGEVTRYSYTSTGLLSGIAYPSGLIVTNIYSGNGFLSSTYSWEEVPPYGTLAYYETNTFAFTAGNLTSFTDGRGLSRAITYDRLNRWTNIVIGGSATLRREFADTTRPLGISKFIDQLGNSTYFKWSNDRKLTSVTNALQDVINLTYCTCGTLESVIDLEGKTNSFEYDFNGRRTKHIMPGGDWASVSYDAVGKVVSRNLSSGFYLTYVNNMQGLPKIVYSASSTEFTAKYDKLNRATNFTMVDGVTINRSFDPVGRILTNRYPDGSFESFSYNSRGLAIYNNPLTYSTFLTNDARGLLRTETDPNSETTHYFYNAAGDVTRLTDGRSKNTYWTIDSFGRVTAKTNHFNTKILGYQYDIAGRLTNRWSIAKQNTTNQYNALGALTNILYQISPGVSFTYDKNGRLRTMIDQFGTTTYGYADWGGLLSEDGPWADDAVSYQYNASRLRTKVTIAQPNEASWVQSYTWDSSLRLDSTISPDGLFDYTPDSVRRRHYSSIALPNGGLIERQYETNGWMNLTRLKNSGGTVLDSHSYLFDFSGQPTRRTRYGGDYIDYGYDAEGQLITALAKESGGANRLNERFGYAYDAGGNLLRRTNSIGAASPLIQTFGVTDQNDLTTVTRSGTLSVGGTSSSSATSVTVSANGGGAVAAIRYGDATFAREGVTLANGNNTFTAIATDSSGRSATNVISINLPSSVSYTYDGNGNLTSDGRRTLGYDDENQLTSVQVSGEWRSEFLYDGRLRRRMRREYSWNGSAWQITNEVRYVYDGLLVVEERDAQNVPRVNYTRGPDLSGGLQGAGGVGGLLARTDSDGAIYYHSDFGGNVTSLMNGSQAITGRYMYDPYGSTISQIGVSAGRNLYRFSSKEVHHSSGLTYYLYRYYDPNIQRWLNRDPIGKRGGINLYGYVANSPIGRIDAFGLSFDNPEDDINEFTTPLSAFLGGGAQMANDINNAIGGFLKGGLEVCEYAPGWVGDTASAALAAMAAADGDALGAALHGANAANPFGAVPPGAAKTARPFGDLIKDAAANPPAWQVIKKEVVPSLNLRNKGGTSVQELLRNEKTGEEIVRHTLLKPDGTVFDPSHFRPFWK